MTNIEKQFFEAFGIEPEELEYPDNLNIILKLPIKF